MPLDVHCVGLIVGLDTPGQQRMKRFLSPLHSQSSAEGIEEPKPFKEMCLACRVWGNGSSPGLSRVQSSEREIKLCMAQELQEGKEDWSQCGECHCNEVCMGVFAS